MRGGAADRVPLDLGRRTNLLGPPDVVRERLALYRRHRDAGAVLRRAAGRALARRRALRRPQRAPGIGEWETTCTVVVREPERGFGWVVGDPGRPAAAWRFTLEPDGEGTLLRQWMRMGPGPSGFTTAITARPDKEEHIVARRLEEKRANLQTTVEGIRSLADAAIRPPS